jgi:predicted RNA methylase
LELAVPVASAIERSPIHPALALSVLAREVLHEQDRKSTGAYHTDFRLATRLAQLAAPKLTHKSKVIDPACGAGILLAALTHAVCGMDRAKTAHWLAHGVYAADLSGNSLRAALLALASFTDDVSTLKAMRARWYCGDSLMADRKVWTAMVPEGFDAVIGNPPWEKVKLSRHEFLKSSGTKRHYGPKFMGLMRICLPSSAMR